MNKCCHIFQLSQIDKFDPSQISGLTDRLKGWSLSKIALNQWHASAVRVIQNEFKFKEDYRKFLDELTEKCVLIISEKIQIYEYLGKEDYYMALTKLFSLLQERKQNESEREKDIKSL